MTYRKTTEEIIKEAEGLVEKGNNFIRFCVYFPLAVFIFFYIRGCVT